MDFIPVVELSSWAACSRNRVYLSNIKWKATKYDIRQLCNNHGISGCVDIAICRKDTCHFSFTLIV